MKKLLIILFCLFIVGCSNKIANLESLKDKPVINNQHKEYLTKFIEVVGEPTEREAVEAIDIIIFYELNDVSVIETYKDTERFDSVFITYKNTNVKDFLKLFIEKNCNYDDIDSLLIKNDINDRYGKCMISHSIKDGEYSFYLGVV